MYDNEKTILVQTESIVLYVEFNDDFDGPFSISTSS